MTKYIIEALHNKERVETTNPEFANIFKKQTLNQQQWITIK